jgi:septum formation protein
LDFLTNISLYFSPSFVPFIFMLSLQKPLILASNSPRRQQLLRDAGFVFEVRVKPTDEDFPIAMPAEEVPVFLAQKKAQAFQTESHQALILTADTIVVVDGQILNKPQDTQEATAMLRLLSGRSHQVMTGLCLLHQGHAQVHLDVATVHFNSLSDTEIQYYIDQCRPFDKAGSYGVQDFIGMVGIPRIEGSFFTVMGLPMHLVYAALQPHLVW